MAKRELRKDVWEFMVSKGYNTIPSNIVIGKVNNLIAEFYEMKQVKNTVDLGNETITQIVDKYRKTNITNKDFSDRLTKAKTI